MATAEQKAALQDKLTKLPEKPGVYLMRDKNGTIIYVGKAKILKNRVRQYFQSSANHSVKTMAMVANIADFEYIICDGEMEALVLECNLIKEHRPHYNILLKDDKHYPYLKLTLQEDYPRLLYVRKIERDGAKYFGPYPSGFSIRETLELLRDIFKIPHCKKQFPRDIGKERPCLYHAMGRCSAPCQGTVGVEEYRKTFLNIADFLDGNDNKVIDDLSREMQAAAEKLEFERAADLRDKLESVKRLSERQKVLSDSRVDIDVLAIAAEDSLVAVEAFYLRRGKLIGRDSFDLSSGKTLEEWQLLGDFAAQYYQRAVYLPNQIYLSHEIEGADVLADYLTAKAGHKVTLRTPKRGDAKRLVDMALKNARQTILNRKTEEVRERLKANAVVELAESLALEVIPDRIESYDISHTSGQETVASMVVFQNGRPAKKEYRHFRVKTVEGANDVESLREVLTRRFTHESREGDNRFSELPDLLLMDGGKPQLGVALEVLDALSLDIPVFGMVKDDRHRSRALIGTEGEVQLPVTGSAFRLVTQIQDEVHRFAIEYHRKLRAKRNLTSELDAISGLGKEKRKALMLHFKRISRIKEASVEELCAVKGISDKLAQRIFNYFRQ